MYEVHVFKTVEWGHSGNTIPSKIVYECIFSPFFALDSEKELESIIPETKEMIKASVNNLHLQLHKDHDGKWC